MSGDKMMMLIMFGLFLVIVATMLGANWYTSKYPTKISFHQIVFFVVALIFGGFFLFIKKLGSEQKTNIIKTFSLQNRVTDIYVSDKRKPYFKEMKFDDGKSLPMPEKMNGILQIGDSIYKNKGEDFYTVVNATTKTRTNFKVKIHERILSKPQ